MSLPDTSALSLSLGALLFMSDLGLDKQWFCLLPLLDISREALVQVQSSLGSTCFRKILVSSFLDCLHMP